MDVSEGELSCRWNIVREQLISLWSLDTKSAAAKEFEVFLNEELNRSCMNLKIFNQTCYFLLGLINKEERDKLIKWPIINTQGQVKFRKGVSKIVKDLADKYGHLNVKKLQDSHLMDPNQNQKKILDFIMRLSNLAIYLALNDPYLFSMSDLSNLNGNEIEIATNTIKVIRLHEEEEIQENEFPIINFDNNWVNIVNKCVSLKQENFNLKNELNNGKKYLLEKGILNKEEDYNFASLKGAYNEKLDELKQINKELEPYCTSGREIVKNVNAVEKPVQLTRQDFGLGKESNFSDTAVEAYDGLSKTFDFIKSKDMNAPRKEEYNKILINLRKTLIKEQDLLRSFIHRCNIERNLVWK